MFLFAATFDDPEDNKLDQGSMPCMAPNADTPAHPPPDPQDP